MPVFAALLVGSSVLVACQDQAGEPGGNGGRGSDGQPGGPGGNGGGGGDGHQASPAEMVVGVGTAGQVEPAG